MAETETHMFAVQIDASKEAVWRELTKTDEPNDAFWHTVLHTTGLQPGSTYQTRTPDGRYVNAIGEILECDPPNRLKQTMRFVRLDDPPVTVTYDLTDADQGGVDLTVVVEGVVPDSKSGKSWGGSGGAEFVAKTIKQLVEDGRAPLSIRAMYRFFDLIGPLGNPKRTRVEHWPFEG